MYKESDPDVEEFRKKSVLAVCAAGTDRSRYISEELTRRGYFATAAGVMRNYNYVTAEDLTHVGTIVFSSPFEKQIFDKSPKLKSIVDREGIQVRVLNISESDKDRAHHKGSIDNLKMEIAKQLDCVGLSDLGKAK